jgi:hypothetical protein
MSDAPRMTIEPRAAIPPDWIVPDWPAPAVVRALVTTKMGGVSEGPWGAGPQGGGMNLGHATGDQPERVEHNRALLDACLPARPRWLALQHGAEVVAAEAVGVAPVAADASTAATPGVVCCVTVADCLPVLLADRTGSVVAAAHAGWRGLAGGVLQAAVIAMRRRAVAPIGPIDAFLVRCAVCCHKPIPPLPPRRTESFGPTCPHWRDRRWPRSTCVPCSGDSGARSAIRPGSTVSGAIG